MFSSLVEAAAGYTYKETPGVTISGNQKVLSANPLRVGLVIQPTGGNWEWSSNPGLLSATGASIFYENPSTSIALTWDNVGPWLQGEWWSLTVPNRNYTTTEILMVPTNPMASSLVAAAAQYAVKESNFSLGTTPTKICSANPNRVSISFSAQFSTLFLGTVNSKPSSTNGSFLCGTQLPATILTFADWGPIVQAEWWACFNSAPPNGLGLAEIIYIPTG